MNDSECMSEIGKNMSRQASMNGDLQKKKTLHIYDFKKFKPLRKEIQSVYKFGKVVGQGAFGQVRVCKHFATGKEFAIKIMSKKEIEQQKIYIKLL
jgi:serine/threonine protein kinase